MKNVLLIMILVWGVIFGCTPSEDQARVYHVKKANGPVEIDARWDKSIWEEVPALEIDHVLGESPKFVPKTRVKLLYDDRHIYVIFRVEDKFVRALPRKPNEEVWKDSCVEFFFSPDNEHPLHYFNLEVNCGGVPLMKHTTVPRKDFVGMGSEDFDLIEIAHSQPETVDPEVEGPLTWTIEYKVPIDLLKKYSGVTQPAPGNKWRANFYKIAEISSNPHYITWSEISDGELSFHKPEFFGELVFD